MFTELPGSYQICEICCWEDDLINLEKMYEAWGPNKVSLIGAMEGRFIGLVRLVNDYDEREKMEAIRQKKGHTKRDKPNVDQI